MKKKKVHDATYDLKLMSADFTGSVNQPNGEQWHYENGLLVKIFGVKDAYVCEVRHFDVERKKRKKAA